MNKFLFLIFSIFFFNIFAMENDQLISQENVDINGNLHQLNFYKKVARFRNYYLELELIFQDQKIGAIDFLPRDETTYEISSLLIDEKFRNQKYGNFLMIYCCTYLKNLNIKKILVNPVPFEKVNGKIRFFNCEKEIQLKEKLYNFYKKFGFEKKDTCYENILYLAKNLA